LQELDYQRRLIINNELRTASGNSQQLINRGRRKQQSKDVSPGVSLSHDSILINRVRARLHDRRIDWVLAKISSQYGR
jgi:hypothetical protein